VFPSSFIALLNGLQQVVLSLCLIFFCLFVCFVFFSICQYSLMKKSCCKSLALLPKPEEGRASSELGKGKWT